MESAVGVDVLFKRNNSSVENINAIGHKVCESWAPIDSPLKCFLNNTWESGMSYVSSDGLKWFLYKKCFFIFTDEFVIVSFLAPNQLDKRNRTTENRNFFYALEMILKNFLRLNKVELYSINGWIYTTRWGLGKYYQMDADYKLSKFRYFKMKDSLLNGFKARYFRNPKFRVWSFEDNKGDPKE